MKIKEENGYLVSYDLNEGEPAESEDYTDEIVAEGTPIALKKRRARMDTSLPVGVTAIQPTMPVTL